MVANINPINPIVQSLPIVDKSAPVVYPHRDIAAKVPAVMKNTVVIDCSVYISRSKDNVIPFKMA